MPTSIREKPPLRLSIDAQTPNGQHRRWAEDESNPANVFSGLRFSSTMPGGFESLSCTLPRKPGISYADLERLTTLTVSGAGGQVAGEYRLESAPRVSGSQMAVTPAAVGWQEHLQDDKSAKAIYVDQDFGSWGESSTQRRLNLLTGGYGLSSSTTTPDLTTGAPSLETGVDGAWAAGAPPISEAWYDAAGIPVGSVYYAWKKGSTVNNADTNWTWDIGACNTDTYVSADTSGNLRAAGPGSGTLTATTSTREFVVVELFYAAVANATDNIHYPIFWTRLAVYGTHGLTKRGTASATEAQGFFASDVVAHAVRTFAPLLTLSEGSAGTVTPTAFVIPQLAFKDPTTAADIVSSANRYHLNDWAVWENRTFYYHERGARGRKWRARIAPAQLSEHGPDTQRLWNGVIVRYQDVDGSTRTVGPTGSNADTTSASVMDTDPLNPANELGLRKWALLDMSGVSTPAGATEVGRRFLIEASQFDSSGQAQLVGHVEDDRGVIRPAWMVRAGDTITFVDASSTAERRIVKAEYNHDTRTCSVELDAPPDGMAALLERLQAVLVPFGIS